MGIYMPNMEMPQKGQMFVIFPDGTSYVCFNGIRERLAQTIAVPVPPHGNLIEKHDVFKLIQAFPEIDELLTVEFMTALYNIPTIIPEEENNHND